MKDLLKVLILIFVVIGVMSFGSWGWQYYTAEIRGTVEAEQQIESVESRIGNYEFFYDLCHSIKAHDRRIEIQKDRLKSSQEGNADDRELSRIRSNIAGIQSVRESAIQRYNSSARQQYTSGRFRASDLPYQINPTKQINCYYEN